MRVIKIRGGITISNLIGVGGGTIISAIAKSLPETNPYKSWLIIFTPTITYLVIDLWSDLLKGKNFFLRKIDYLRTKRKLERLVKRTMDNPTISDENKEGIRLDLEELHLTRIKQLTKRLREIESDLINKSSF